MLAYPFAGHYAHVRRCSHQSFPRPPPPRTRTPPPLPWRRRVRTGRIHATASARPSSHPPGAPVRAPTRHGAPVPRPSSHPLRRSRPRIRPAYSSTSSTRRAAVRRADDRPRPPAVSGYTFALVHQRPAPTLQRMRPSPPVHAGRWPTGCAAIVLRRSVHSPPHDDTHRQCPPPPQPNHACWWWGLRRERGARPSLWGRTAPPHRPAAYRLRPRVCRPQLGERPRQPPARPGGGGRGEGGAAALHSGCVGDSYPTAAAAGGVGGGDTPVPPALRGRPRAPARHGRCRPVDHPVHRRRCCRCWRRRRLCHDMAIASDAAASAAASTSASASASTSACGAAAASGVEPGVCVSTGLPAPPLPLAHPHPHPHNNSIPLCTACPRPPAPQLGPPPPSSPQHTLTAGMRGGTS